MRVFKSRSGVEIILSEDEADKIGNALAEFFCEFETVKLLAKEVRLANKLLRLLENPIPKLIPKKQPWYKVLGVDSTATRDEVDIAYLNLCGIHHPDFGGDGIRWQEINQAMSDFMQKSSIEDGPGLGV